MKITLWTHFKAIGLDDRGILHMPYSGNRILGHSNWRIYSEDYSRPRQSVAPQDPLFNTSRHEFHGISSLRFMQVPSLNEIRLDNRRIVSMRLTWNHLKREALIWPSHLWQIEGSLQFVAMNINDTDSLQPFESVKGQNLKNYLTWKGLRSTELQKRLEKTFKPLHWFHHLWMIFADASY